MTEFFETSMGYKFYEGTMPRLIKAVNRLADALTDPWPPTKADLTFMDDMGEIELKEELIKRVQLIEQLRAHRDALLNQLAINHPPSPDTMLCEDFKNEQSSLGGN